MKSEGKSIVKLVLFALTLFSLNVFMSCNDKDDQMGIDGTAKIQISEHATLGKVLTDAEGVTLYYYSKDADGSSACLDGCLDKWPVFYAEDAELGDGLENTDFGTITRSDEEMQTTYKGWPLYYYAPSSDGVVEAPGAITGDGVGNVWFAAKPDYSIMLANAQLVGNDGNNYTSSYEVGEGATTFFVDASGRTLYAFIKDYHGKNNFTKSDFSNDGSWPIYTAELEAVASSLSADDFGTIDVFGMTQITYKGWPLYYFGQDTERGQTKGVSVPSPGVWPIVNTEIEEAPAAPTIKISDNDTHGQILTDSDGKTLYYFSKDPSGISKCTGGCLNAWPLFYTEEIILTGQDLSADDFQNMEQEGTMITTYKGWPLYYYSPTGDGEIEEAGSTAGDGVGGVWYVMKKNSSLMIAKAQLVGNDGNNYLEDYTVGDGETTYFTDAKGNTLYIFTNDTNNDNNFTASDFSNDGSWPIFYVEIDQLPSDISADDLGTIDVFGRSQLTYKGWPVYYYGGDEARGQTKGVSVPTPGKWPIVNNNLSTAP
ncbi:MAG: hypothetical protein RLO17_25000 [Cyclobacteriaceae bacterium]